MARPLLLEVGMNRPVHMLCTLLAAAVFGCSSDGFQEGNGGDSQDVGDGAGPRSGEYFLIDLPDSDSCGTTGITDTDLQLVDIKVSDDGKSLTFKDEETEISCTSKAGKNFTCDVKIPGLKFPDLGVETIAEGTLELRDLGGGRLEGEYSATLDCQGKGCEGLAAQFPEGLPCKSSGKYIGVPTMPQDFAPEVGDYEASVSAPTLNTCDAVPTVAANQSISIQVQEDGTAKVFPDGSEVPHDCRFESKGRVGCFRLVENEDDTESFSRVDATWTGATSFEGLAVLEIQCADGGDCSGSKFGELPCHAIYHVEGEAAGAASAN